MEKVPEYFSIDDFTINDAEVIENSELQPEKFYKLAEGFQILFCEGNFTLHAVRKNNHEDNNKNHKENILTKLGIESPDDINILYAHYEHIEHSCKTITIEGCICCKQKDSENYLMIKFRGTDKTKTEKIEVLGPIVTKDTGGADEKGYHFKSSEVDVDLPTRSAEERKIYASWYGKET